MQCVELYVRQGVRLRDPVPQTADEGLDGGARQDLRACFAPNPKSAAVLCCEASFWKNGL